MEQVHGYRKFNVYRTLSRLGFEFPSPPLPSHSLTKKSDLHVLSGMTDTLMVGYLGAYLAF